MQFYRRIFIFFYIIKKQDTVNSPTPDACWIKFIVYRTPGKNKIVAQWYSKDINQQNVCVTYFDWFSRRPSCSSDRHAKISLNVKIPDTVYFAITPRIFDQVISKSIKSSYPIKTLKVNRFS